MTWSLFYQKVAHNEEKSRELCDRARPVNSSDRYTSPLTHTASCQPVSVLRATGSHSESPMFK